jgi:hypothetical protein
MSNLQSENRKAKDLAKRDAASEDAPVLVAVMNNLRDFEIARDQGWYRIPLERAPSRVGADYLALYQTKAFGQERWAINYYAPIKRFHIVSRQILLPEEPDHPRAKQLYYKIEIEPLRRLSHPIPSRRLRRITFIPTTLDRLLHAEEINDLWCGSAAQEKLWRAFKENGITAERYYSPTEEDETRQIDFALFCKDGNIAVLCEGEVPVENIHIVCEQSRIEDYELTARGWTVLCFTANKLSKSLSPCLTDILATIAQNGGLLALGLRSK